MSDLASTPARNPKPRIHLIGIGGSGLSAIARFLLESGYPVSGSDHTLSPLARELAAAGVHVSAGHRAENVQGADLVVRSSAVPEDNVEVQAAQAAGIPVLKRAQFLGYLMADKSGIAVAGTHGKTTTTAMVAWLLTAAGADPSYIIGGTAKNLGGQNAHAGTGDALVIEADEYDRMFLGLDPDRIVITSLEHDHPDCYPTPEDYFGAFAAFIQRLKPGGMLFLPLEYAASRPLMANRPPDTRAFTYGMRPEADYSAENLVPNAQGGFDYDAFWRPAGGEKSLLAHIGLQVPGEHNVRNSLAALALLHQQAPEGQREAQMRGCAQALAAFTGTGRRFDVLGEAGGVLVVDDYAHHPTKIQATLAAARARYPQRRIWAVWQPHTFSRTRAFAAQFARAFQDADQVLVSDIYAAREKASDFDFYSAEQVVQAMPRARARYIPGLQAIGDYLLQNLRPGDVLLVLSAGDADQICTRVLAALRERTNRHD